MDQPPNSKPVIKDFIIENWNEYKMKSLRELKQELKDVCVIPSGPELTVFQDWLNNKKKSERKQLLMNNQQINDQVNNNVTSQSDLAKQIYLTEVELLLQSIQNIDRNGKLLKLRHQIEENPLLLMNYMQTRQMAPTSDFLGIMIDICNEQRDDTKLSTLLFIRVCALHVNEYLNVSEPLLMNGFIELSTKQNDSKAAYGILKLAFQNNITFVQFTQEALIQFQERYQLVFQSFYQSLSQDVDYQVIKCLPETCYLFTGPFYNELQQGASRLHQRITPQYLPQFISLVAYSFDNNQDSFDSFIDMFKHCCLQLYNQEFDLNSILNAIANEEILKNPKFFGSLQNATELLKHMLEMINEQIILVLDEQTINKLLKGNELDYKQRRQQPKQIAYNKQFENILKQYILHFQKGNQHLGQVLQNIPYEEDQLLKNIASKFNILQMNQVQMISAYIMESVFQKQKVFQQFETGIGKTTLSLIFMIYAKQKFEINSISIYHSEELCYRDFLRIQQICQDLKINCAYVNTIDQANFITGADIIFITNKVFEDIHKQDEIIDTLINFLLIIDEFDSILFKADITLDQIQQYTNSKFFIGFTGSNLDKIHINVLNKAFNSIYLQYPLSENIEGRQNNCRETKIFNKRQDQLPYIVEVCQRQQLLTPVLLIIEQSAHRGFIDEAKQSLNIKDLSIMKPQDIYSFLKTSFLSKQNDRYYTCFISNAQGRGLDIPSNQFIEQNGGVTIIIAIFPINQREFDQFKGRTKRMCNKGQHFVLLWDQNRNNNQLQLEEELYISQSTELLMLNNILLQINPKKVQKNSKRAANEEDKEQNFNNEPKKQQEEKKEEIKQQDKHICKIVKQNGQNAQKNQDTDMNDEKNKEELKGNNQKPQTERIKVTRENGIDFYAELSDFTQFKFENLENNQGALEEAPVKELNALRISQKKRVQKGQSKEFQAKGKHLTSVNIGKKTVPAITTNAQLIGENDKTPAKGFFIESSEILGSLKQEGQKKKYVHGSAGVFGFQEHKDVIAKIGKRQTRQSQGKEEEGSKKQKLMELKDKQIQHETNKNKMIET